MAPEETQMNLQNEDELFGLLEQAEAQQKEALQERIIFEEPAFDATIHVARILAESKEAKKYKLRTQGSDLSPRLLAYFLNIDTDDEKGEFLETAILDENLRLHHLAGVIGSKEGPKNILKDAADLLYEEIKRTIEKKPNHLVEPRIGQPHQPEKEAKTGPLGMVAPMDSKYFIAAAEIMEKMAFGRRVKASKNIDDLKNIIALEQIVSTIENHRRRKKTAFTVDNPAFPMDTAFAYALLKMVERPRLGDNTLEVIGRYNALLRQRKRETVKRIDSFSRDFAALKEPDYNTLAWKIKNAVAKQLGIVPDHFTKINSGEEYRRFKDNLLEATVKGLAIDQDNPEIKNGDRVMRIPAASVRHYAGDVISTRTLPLGTIGKLNESLELVVRDEPYFIFEEELMKVRQKEHRIIEVDGRQIKGWEVVENDRKFKVGDTAITSRALGKERQINEPYLHEAPHGTIGEIDPYGTFVRLDNQHQYIIPQEQLAKVKRRTKTLNDKFEIGAEIEVKGTIHPAYWNKDYLIDRVNAYPQGTKGIIKGVGAKFRIKFDTKPKAAVNDWGIGFQEGYAQFTEQEIDLSFNPEEKEKIEKENLLLKKKAAPLLERIIAEVETEIKGFEDKRTQKTITLITDLQNLGTSAGVIKSLIENSVPDASRYIPGTMLEENIFTRIKNAQYAKNYEGKARAIADRIKEETGTIFYIPQIRSETEYYAFISGLPERMFNGYKMKEGKVEARSGVALVIKGNNEVNEGTIVKVEGHCGSNLHVYPLHNGSEQHARPEQMVKLGKILDGQNEQEIKKTHGSLIALSLKIISEVEKELAGDEDARVNLSRQAIYELRTIGYEEKDIKSFFAKKGISTTELKYLF